MFSLRIKLQYCRRAIPKEAWFARRDCSIDHPSRGIGRRAGDAAGMATCERRRPVPKRGRTLPPSGVRRGRVVAVREADSCARPRHRPGYPRSRATPTARRGTAHRRVGPPAPAASPSVTRNQLPPTMAQLASCREREMPSMWARARHVVRMCARAARSTGQFV